MRFLLLPPFVLLSYACGIKANPEVLKAPEVEIRRIGDRVFVRSLSGDIKVKDFEKVGHYWVKERPEAFCFVVERLEGKSQKFCVERALEQAPAVRLVEEETAVVLLPSGFESFHLYPLKEGHPLLEGKKSSKGEFFLQRDYRELCYLLTGVKGSVESSPLKVCIGPKKPPPVEEVKDLQIREGKENIYLLWFYSQEYREFVIYQDGKEVGRTTGFSVELPRPDRKTTFRVKAVHPMGFESSGVSIDYSP